MHLCLQELGEVHTGFHSQLRKAVSYGPQSGGRLGEVFLAWKEHFLIYGDYCANLPAAQAMLNDICLKRELFNQEVLVSINIFVHSMRNIQVAF
jgi:guanine nucleotide exchange factor VAV